MPPGFIKNHSYPEIPAAARYLQQFNGQKFENPEIFSESLSGYKQYLKEIQLPREIKLVDDLVLYPDGMVSYGRGRFLGQLEKIVTLESVAPEDKINVIELFKK